MDFEKSVFENSRKRPLICAHRGVSGGNIPCNTIPAFKGALLQHCDMIELDVTRSKDGVHFVFHPGMERAHLKSRLPIAMMNSSKVKKLRFVNGDDTKTELGVFTLEEVLTFLKGKCYINVDKFWMDVKGITEVIRKTGVEKQVIVKTPDKKKYYDEMKKYCPDFMYLPVIRSDDGLVEKLCNEGLNCIGAEILFETKDSPLYSDDFVKRMHENKKVVFANSEVYDYKSVISAGLNDDTAISNSPQEVWGIFVDKGFDIIQTDWPGLVYDYFTTADLF